MADEADEREGRVWCPTCYRFLPAGDDSVTMETSVQNVTLHPDGRLDLGHRDDAFLDYWHMACGTRVRVAANATWDGEAYGPEPDPPIEVYGSADPDRCLVPIGYRVSDDPARWGPTLLALRASHYAAVAGARLFGDWVRATRDDEAFDRLYLVAAEMASDDFRDTVRDLMVGWGWAVEDGGTYLVTDAGRRQLEEDAPRPGVDTRDGGGTDEHGGRGDR